jgi:hypothetical protein
MIVLETFELVCRRSREVQQNGDSLLATAVDQFMIRLIVIRKKAPITAHSRPSRRYPSLKLRALCWILRRLRAGR